MKSRWLLPLLYALLNIASATGIVFANKVVFSVYSFNFTCTLTLIHTLCTLVGLKAFVALDCFKAGKHHVPLAKVAPLSLAFVAYIVLCNWNLNMNTVSFYQISKILVAPVVIALEAMLFGRIPTIRVCLSVLVVCVGIGVATVHDAQMASNTAGLGVGLGAVLSTAMYQIWAGSKQKELGIGSFQLLYESTPLSAAALMVIVPCVEPLGLWGDRTNSVLGFRYTLPAVVAILLSAALGLVVSLSTFLVIGATSSLTYNIVGHLKTVIILAGGCLFFGDEMPTQKMLGIVLAMLGIVWFSRLNMAALTAPKRSSPRLPLTSTQSRHGPQLAHNVFHRLKL